MSDQITQGVRISTQPIKSEITLKPHNFISLSIKFILAIFFCLFIFVVFILIAPIFQTSIDKYTTILILILWTLCIYGILSYLFINPINILLDWFRRVRASGFENIPATPILYSDEIGRLGQEINASVSIIWQSDQKIKELLAHKSDTMTLIEHQLRTSLTSLKWSMEGVDIPQNVLAAVSRVDESIQDIINATRIGEGTFGYVFNKIDIVAVLDKLITLFKPRAENRGVTLSFEHPPSTPFIKADADRISTVISNILSNAIDYTHKGGTVSVSITIVNQSLEVSVKDTGIGMSQEDLANVFNKMYRGKNARLMRSDGSGLGLYVAKNILNEHKAEVMVRSKEGLGTEFSFRIDLVN